MVRFALPTALLAALTLAASGCSAEGCPSGEEVCGGVCVDPATFQSDADNCGACGISCGLGTCASGSCACDASATLCLAGDPRCVDLQSDPAHCGGCETRCSASVGCASGLCCPGARPVGCGDRCCAGTGCCGTGQCQTQHANGLGQSYFDCVPVGTYDAVQAEKAARAWQSAGTPTAALQCPIGCLGWQTATACAVWCWGAGPSDLLRGRVQLTTISPVCVCPAGASPTWD